jgi:hypothetical protein
VSEHNVVPLHQFTVFLVMTLHCQLSFELYDLSTRGICNVNMSTPLNFEKPKATDAFMKRNKTLVHITST